MPGCTMKIKTLRPMAALLLALPCAAHASFLPPALMDSVSWGVAWFVIVVMPIAGIVLFWIVHVMPEKIAHKRHHPQRDQWIDAQTAHGSDLRIHITIAQDSRWR